MYKIYLNGTEGATNATTFYVDIIEKAIKKAGNDVCRINSPNRISKNDTVVVISSLTFFRAWKRNPKSIITWWQGISPEEYWMRKDNIIIRLTYRAILSWLEKFALKRCDFNIFVSESLIKHYNKKYGFKGGKYIIMPCFNEVFHIDAFFENKYKKPTFVYAGNMESWQCFSKIVCLYKKIKETLQDAEFTVYSKDKEIAQTILNTYEVNAEIRYVPYQQLSQEIKKFKYGFLIRDDIAVNNVATPTKMSSYIANGIIPIFSNIIGDFNKYIAPLQYSIPVGNNFQGLEKLYILEKRGIELATIKAEYEMIFRTYYNESKYIESIATFLK